jgi:hypothetical protein
MNHLKNTFMANFFDASAKYAERRAANAPESERQFWLGRAAADRAAGTLKKIQAVELILNLRKNHSQTPAFATLCENLTTF